MKKTIKELTIHFWASIIVLAVLFLLAIFNPGGSIAATLPIGIATEMYVIGITLLAIPIPLKLFANKIKKIPVGTDKERVIKLYKRAFFLRLYIVNIVALANILLYALSRNTNFMWLTVVLFVVFAFCRPSLGEIENIIKEESK